MGSTKTVHKRISFSFLIGFLRIHMIFGLLLLFINFVPCLCYDYYMEYNPLWNGSGVRGLSNEEDVEDLPCKLYYMGNDTSVK